VLERMLAKGWVRREKGSRAVVFSAAGKKGFVSLCADA
jgi:predicted transcriptional regulator